MEIDNRLLSLIICNGKDEIEIPGVSCILPTNDSNKLLIMEETAQKIVDIIKNTNSQELIFFHLRGIKGSGKRTQVIRVANIIKVTIIMVDLSIICNKEELDFSNLILTICREAIVSQGLICCYNFNIFQDEKFHNQHYEDIILKKVKRFSSFIFICSNIDNKKDFNNNLEFI